MSLTNLTRREFVRRSTLLAAAGAGAPWALNLAAIGEAAAQAGGGDYRAIVCVFLYGGNDYGNTLVPYDIDNYNRYQAIRPTIAVTRDSLLNTTLTGATTGPGTVLAAGRQYALAAQLAPLKPVFDAGKMGVLLNIGPLIQPTTLAQYNARNVPLPPKLFSHNDQQSVWQSSLAEGATSGWGGRIGDLFLGSNGNSTFTCVNVSGNAVFMSGQTAVQYQVSTGGSVALNGIQNTLFGSAACASTLRTLVTATRTNLIENEHTRVMNRSIAANVQLSPALTAVPTTTAPA